jgi:hypothetical protein
MFSLGLSTTHYYTDNNNTAHAPLVDVDADLGCQGHGATFCNQTSPVVMNRTEQNRTGQDRIERRKKKEGRRKKRQEWTKTDTSRQEYKVDRKWTERGQRGKREKGQIKERTKRAKRAHNQHNISVRYVCIHIHPTLHTYTTSPVPQCLWSCLLGLDVPGTATRGKTSISCVGKIGWDPSRSSHLSKAKSPLGGGESEYNIFP